MDGSGSLAELELLTAVETGLESVGCHDTEGLLAVEIEFLKFLDHPMVCTAVWNGKVRGGGVLV